MKNIEKIILHCSATQEGRHFDVKDIDAWHKRKGWNGCGYHYVITLDGTIQAGRPIHKQGAHTKGLNSTSIGICYIGGVEAERGANGKWIPKDTRTDDQKESILLLMKVLRKMHPGATIHGHRDFSAKACPSFDATMEYSEI